MSLRVDLRAACMSLLTDYAASASVKLQVYPGRPLKISAPCAFVDVVRESRVYHGVQLVQRTAQADIIILHGPRLADGGSFDSALAVNQADAFVDGFSAWIDANVHEIGPNTTIGTPNIEDDATYTPDWTTGELLTYYATRITVEGYAASLTI